MKKKSLEKLLERTKNFIGLLLNEDAHDVAFTEFGKGIKAGQEIALNSLLDYIKRCEEDLKDMERLGLDNLL